jgi:hypothetical protein
MLGRRPRQERPAGSRLPPSQARGSSSATPCGPEPARASITRTRLARAGLGAAAAGIGLQVLAGCGTSAATAPQAGQTCGTARTGVNVPVIVEIGQGRVSCGTALRVEESYATLVRNGDVRGNGGGAPVKVSGWTCQGFPTPEVLKTGQTSACHSHGAEILAVLPPPSALPPHATIS